MPPHTRTIIVSNIGRCWNLIGTNRSVCEATFTVKNVSNKKEKKKRKTLIALSTDPSHEEIPKAFETDVECDPDILKKRGYCVPKIVLQPIKCDPKKEKCDPYYYRNA